MTKHEKIAAIAASYVRKLTPQDSGEDHENRELARQLSEKAASYHRDGWSRQDYQKLKENTWDSVMKRLEEMQDN